MIEVRKTDLFAKWLDNLRDIRARARIMVRIERLVAGNPGDVNRSEKESLNYGSIMDRVIGCILNNMAVL